MLSTINSELWIPTTTPQDVSWHCMSDQGTVFKLSGTDKGGSVVAPSWCSCCQRWEGNTQRWSHVVCKYTSSLEKSAHSNSAIGGRDDSNFEFYTEPISAMSTLLPLSSGYGSMYVHPRLQWCQATPQQYRKLCIICPWAMRLRTPLKRGVGV